MSHVALSFVLLLADKSLKVSLQSSCAVLLPAHDNIQNVLFSEIHCFSRTKNVSESDNRVKKSHVDYKN